MMIYTDLTRKAMNLAYKAHDGQLDKSGVPYIFHPMFVAEQMKEEDTTVIALLHDVLEDTELTVEELVAEGFSKEIIDAVLLLTRTEHEDYLEYVKRIKVNEKATKVKLADLKHNSDCSRLACITEFDRKRLNKYFEAIKILKNE